MPQVEEFIIKLKDQFSSGLNTMDEQLDDTRDGVDELSGSFEDLKKVAGGLAVALGLDALIDATKEFQKMKSAVAAYTGETGDAADDMITQARAIAATYDVEASDVLQSANAMTKQMGGTMESNIALITEGFRKGANVNGEFLRSLYEYPAQFRAAGLDASQSIALISQAAKQGVYDDKAADTIKEMTLSLREMTQIQRDALDSIGIDSNKLLADMNSGAVSPFQAMQKIVGVMDDFDVAAQQTIIADIFKGAGEDAGIQFIKSLDTINLNLSEMETSGNGFNDGMLAMYTLINEVKTSILTGLSPVLGGLAEFLTNNTGLLKGIAVALGILGAALLAVKIQTIALTIAQTGLNLSMLANPVFLIVAAIGALTAGIVYAYNNFETFRKIMDGLWKALKIVGSFIADIFIGIWDMLSNAASRVADVFRSIIPQIKSVFVKIGEFIKKYHPIAIMIRGVKSMFPKFYNSLVEKFQKMFGFIGRIFKKIKKFFGFGDDATLTVNEQKVAENGSDDDDAGFVPTGSLTGGDLVSTATSASNLKSGVGSISNTAPKQFNINIDRLIDKFEISTQRIEQSREQIRDMVLETLLDAVNDVQISID